MSVPQDNDRRFVNNPFARVLHPASFHEPKIVSMRHRNPSYRLVVQVRTSDEPDHRRDIAFGNAHAG